MCLLWVPSLFLMLIALTTALTAGIYVSKYDLIFVSWVRIRRIPLVSIRSLRHVEYIDMGTLLGYFWPFDRQFRCMAVEDKLGNFTEYPSCVFYRRHARGIMIGIASLTGIGFVPDPENGRTGLRRRR
ncbi:hypothetical protein D9V34_01280 [Mycetocola lacteus]|uniref:PH domain-containing protein n=2 Tax=Mycetocola lacteus TaxID=76637 RepID=A0A3L7AYQ6_9MICO|nr:hypothetical protein D9V34_13575 [Mycetocola lacteus]RLP84661.1 hypothetical protein D9V34_01280 [Mycetocola lacteus]